MNKDKMYNSDSPRVRKLENQLAILWVLFGFMAIGTIFSLKKSFSKSKEEILPDVARFVNILDALDEKISFNADTGISQAVQDNYLNYLNKAYILIGDYPDCEYIRISPDVERNNYDWSKDFYVKEGDLYYNYYKDGECLGRIGIDVSEFQKEIDWEKVKGVGIDVAMIRIGYRGYGTGVIKDDQNAEANLKGAAAAGISTGVYFFSSAINASEGKEEADYVINRLSEMGISSKDLKETVCIDTEYIFEGSSRTNDISVEDRTAAVAAFCEEVEAAGYTPMIYASRDQFIRYLDIDTIGKWDFWIAAYDPPKFPYHAEGYQYTPYGYVDGIDSHVDLNVWMR